VGWCDYPRQTFEIPGRLFVDLAKLPLEFPYPFPRASNKFVIGNTASQLPILQDLHFEIGALIL
jgi:hypothetical protein